MDSFGFPFLKENHSYLKKAKRIFSLDEPRYRTRLIDKISVADPDPGSGAFLTLDPDPGSGIGFFPHPGSRIPDPNPIFFRA
jgi:hypothetical protein